ncbi:sulfatase, partial [Actinacidiphila sp. bgisy160]|uniref:sulfatase n=1 Tax=Actinacidiphila sp. bgisy160 TaxID=3413796 RepID=UPI003D73DF6A
MSLSSAHQRPVTDQADTRQQPPPGDAPEEAAAKPAKETAEETAEPEANAKTQEAAAPAADSGTEDEQAPEADPGDPAAPAAGSALARWRERHPDVTRAVSWSLTILAGGLVLFAFLMPDRLPQLTASRFARVPSEPVLLAALLLVLPPRPRRVVAVLSGVLLGLLVVLNCVDMGFYQSLQRPFHPLFDWPLFSDGLSFLKDSAGGTTAYGALAGALLAVLALLVLMPLAILRLCTLMLRHPSVARRSTLVAGVVWMTCATLGIQVSGLNVAAKEASSRVRGQVVMVRQGLADQKVFAKKVANDPFAKVPSDQLLSGLRGKDVIFTFIESYGRGAVEDPAMAPDVDAVLRDGTRKLADAGFSARSGWLTSPVTGGGSWLAHTTFLSGLWVQDQQRYRYVSSSDRMTLTSAFKRTGDFRTVGMMPGVTRAWPESKFFGLDHVHDSRTMGYQGPKFSWSPVPDQYTLSAFERLEHGRARNQPMMSEIILTSSHNPWAPIPRMIDWDQVGDGSVYDAIKKEGKDRDEVWKDPRQVRREYGRAIQYSLNSLIEFVTKYGNENTVLVFLGDHQPVSTVVGVDASRDVPVAIVAHDPKVLDQVSGWGWSEGLRPEHNAPVWRMDAFRDRFLTAFSSPQS